MDNNPEIEDIVNKELTSSKKGSGSHDSESAEELWRKTYNKPSSVDKLMGMIGLESVKMSVVNQYQKICIAKEQGQPATGSYNARFDGNPGTGLSM